MSNINGGQPSVRTPLLAPHTHGHVHDAAHSDVSVAVSESRVSLVSSPSKADGILSSPSSSYMYRDPSPPSSMALFCFGIIGISSWSMVTSLFAEGPYLVHHTPEGYKLYARIDLCCQLANVFPMIYMIWTTRMKRATVAAARLHRTLSSLSSSSNGDFIASPSGVLPIMLGFQHNPSFMRLRVFVVALLFIGLANSILLSLGWSVTITIGGESVSILFLLSCFLSGTVGSMSLVCFFPLAALFGRSAVSALSIGTGLCGITSSLMALAQGVTDAQPRFLPSHYFVYLIGMYTIALLAFLYITTATAQPNLDVTAPNGVAFPSPATIVSIASGVGVPKKKKRHTRVPQHTHIHVTPASSATSQSSSALSSHAIEHHHQQQQQQQQQATKLASVVDNSGSGSDHMSDNDTQCVGAVVLYWINIGVSCCTEYAIPALLPYLTGHDDGDSDQHALLFWLTTSWALGGLGGRALTFSRCFRHTSARQLTIINMMQALLSIYCFIAAYAQQHHLAWHPAPFISLPILFMCSFANGYIVTMVFQLASTHGSWQVEMAGLFNQLGAITGALFSFVLVEIGLFTT